jgi:peptidoglycan/LPS O-acetylase OafA/YrhL
MAFAQHTAAETKRAGFRMDIQGLRAFAVVAVVLDHLLGWPAGGFIGVDVFFVISGFLITGILLRQYEKTGFISIKDFYARRVKRILPAAVLTLFATTVAAYIIWPTIRAPQTLLDSLSALFFVSNWHFIRVGADYLQADAPVSPVQHFWSLSIEEQFYMLWPLILLGILLLATRRRWSHRPIIAITSVLVVGSMAVAAVSTHFAARIAYFETIGRTWELGAGVLLALSPLLLKRIGPRLGLVMSWLGVAAIVVSAFVLTPSSPFPFPGALLPVAGAVLVIAGGTAGKSSVLLINRLSSWTGKVSYSLYLWHFPIIIFGLSLAGPNASVWVYVLLAALMLAVSYASWRFVEEPARTSKLFTSAKSGNRHAFELVAGIAIVALAGSLVAVQLRGPAIVAQGALLQSALAGEAATPASKQWSDDGVLQASIISSVDATSWPESLTPSLASLGETSGAPAMSTTTGCLNNIHVANPHSCTSNGTGKVAVVVGDSVAMSWVPAVEQALPGWTVYALGFASCPAIPVQVGTAASDIKACTADQAKMSAYAKSKNPDLVITSAAQSSLQNLSQPDDPAAQWQAASENMLTSYGGFAAHVAILANPPQGDDPSGCVVSGAGPARCVSPVGDLWVEKQAAESAAAKSVGGAAIDTEQWFCANDECPIFVNNVFIRYDTSHLTNAASESYGDLLRRSLQNSGALI